MKTKNESAAGQVVIIVQALGVLAIAKMIEIVSMMLVISLEAAAVIVNALFSIGEIVV
jgi:hypothetical protein